MLTRIFLHASKYLSGEGRIVILIWLMAQKLEFKEQENRLVNECSFYEGENELKLEIRRKMTLNQHLTEYGEKVALNQTKQIQTANIR